MKTKIALLIAIFLTACASQEQMAARQMVIDGKRNEMVEAQNAAAVLKCNGKEMCDRMFRIASDSVTDFSDMKIQTATTNYIATYNPIKYGKVGISVKRTLDSGDKETIFYIVNCRGMSGDLPLVECFDRVAGIYRAYKVRMDALK